MAKFKMKMEEIEAIQWDGDAFTANHFLGDRYGIDWEYTEKTKETIDIPVFNSYASVEVGDWIIKGINGDFFAWKSNAFESTYEEVI